MTKAAGLLEIGEVAVRVAEETIIHHERPGIYQWADEAIGLLEDIKAIRDRNAAEDAATADVLQAGVAKTWAEKTLVR